MASPERRPAAAQKRSPWAGVVFVLAVTLSAFLSLLAQLLLGQTGLILALVVRLVFILLGIAFDILGVAVTAADARPFHSMAAHMERGAKQALALLKKADRVSSVCNDVVGDICGIVSGTTAAVIVGELHQAFDLNTVLLSTLVTALISGVTIGGKALGKTLALRESTAVVHLAGRVLAVFQL